MAQRFFRADDYPVGTTLADLGFVPMQGATTATAWAVVDNWAAGKSFYYANNNSSSPQMYAHQEESSAEFEFLVQVIRRAWLRASTFVTTTSVNDSYDWFRAGRGDRQTRIVQGANGSFSQLASGERDTGQAGTLQTWRVKLTHTEQKLKVWYGDLGDEPVAWSLETTSDVTGRGMEYPGIGNRGEESYDILWFSWGTDGDPAPTGPVGPTTPTNLTTTNITATGFRSEWTA